MGCICCPVTGNASLYLSMTCSYNLDGFPELIVLLSVDANAVTVFNAVLLFHIFLSSLSPTLLAPSPPPQSLSIWHPSLYLSPSLDLFLPYIPLSTSLLSRSFVLALWSYFLALLLPSHLAHFIAYNLSLPVNRKLNWSRNSFGVKYSIAVENSIAVETQM